MEKKLLLEFEKPVEELKNNIEKLKTLAASGRAEVQNEIKKMEERLKQLCDQIYGNLSPNQIVQIARHPQRPTTLDFIQHLAESFVEIHGDRYFGNDPAMVGGFGKINGTYHMLIGTQKGNTTKENLARNFGMAHPEGYRKALRLMKLAEKFGRPILTLVDTPGAYPGIGAEERGQAEAIARNLKEMSLLRTPIISVITGEGGSGGALGIAVGSRVFMLEYSIYSVISPEGCASILFRDSSRSAEAAESMKITAPQLLKLGVIDEIIKEPLGGAHHDLQTAANNIKETLLKHLKDLQRLPADKLTEERFNKFRKMGVFERI